VAALAKSTRQTRLFSRLRKRELVHAIRVLGLRGCIPISPRS
jgi:hypothetical protein